MVTISETEARSILTPQKVGRLGGRYGFSLNPYRGCAFGCSYCYAKGFTHDPELESSWGEWVRPKANAPGLLYREAGKLAFARVFMSSATDPYQPAEREHRLSRACLEVMLSMLPGPDLIHIHTRSPFVLDDLNLLLAFGDRIEVAMSITTDDERVRRIWEPTAPAIPRRLETLRALTQAGVATRASVSPLLPCDPARLATLVAGATGRAYVDAIRFPKPAGYGDDLYGLHGLRRYLSPQHPREVAEALRAELGSDRVSSFDSTARGHSTGALTES